jgi:hypothetical protein
MKLTPLLSNLITEASRLEVVYDKYVKPNPKLSQKGQPPRGIMTFETLKSIIFGDPTTRVSENFDVESATLKDMEKVHIGKYVQWMLKNYTQPVLDSEVGSDEYKLDAKEYRRLFIEDLDKLKLDLLKYERFKGRLPEDQREINRLTPETLYNAVEEFKLDKKSMSNKEEKIVKENPYKYPGSVIDFVGPNWTVVKISEKTPEGKNAACYFGGYYDTQDQYDETSWCTSNPTYTNFESYIKDGPLYVILPNSSTEFGQKTGLPKERYQFHFPSNQFMNRRDRSIDLPDFFNSRASELKDYFQPKFERHPFEFKTDYIKSDRCNITITQNRKMAQYVAIFGEDKEPFDFNKRIQEIFEEITPSIVQLNLKNETPQDINIDIPENINRFKDVQTIMFTKCVRSIPTSICSLDDLHHLALVNCSQLVGIPDCVADLIDKSLSFLNIDQSNPSLKLPERFKQYIDNDEPGFIFIDKDEDDTEI